MLNRRKNTATDRQLSFDCRKGRHHAGPVVVRYKVPSCIAALAASTALAKFRAKDHWVSWLTTNDRCHTLHVASASFVLHLQEFLSRSVLVEPIPMPTCVECSSGEATPSGLPVAILSHQSFAVGASLVLLSLTVALLLAI